MITAIRPHPPISPNAIRADIRPPMRPSLKNQEQLSELWRARPEPDGETLVVGAQDRDGDIVVADGAVVVEAGGAQIGETDIRGVVVEDFHTELILREPPAAGLEVRLQLVKGGGGPVRERMKGKGSEEKIRGGRLQWEEGRERAGTDWNVH